MFKLSACLVSYTIVLCVFNLLAVAMLWTQNTIIIRSMYLESLISKYIVATLTDGRHSGALQRHRSGGNGNALVFRSTDSSGAPQ